MAIKSVANALPHNIADLPACAIDLGFSESDTSVGIAFRPDFNGGGSELTFGDCINRVNDWLTHQHNQCVIVVEAPLTMALTERGNPCHRHIELQRNYERGCAPRSPKGWYYQAGANLSLGSTILLRELRVPEGLIVLLVEGFYCSTTPDEVHASHQLVAESLLSRLHALAGQSLVTPRAEVCRGTVRLLPSLEDIVDGIPGILLREGLNMVAETADA